MPMTGPQKRQLAAAQRTGYGPIWLRRIGDQVVVSVTKNGHWHDVIAEGHDGNFSHIIEPIGIEEALLNKRFR